MASTVSEISSKLKEKFIEVYRMTIGKFISSLFRRPSSILFLGIDNAGKTTLVNKLKNNTNHVFLPTKHATKDVVEIGNLKAQVIDIGGHQAARIAWKDYFFKVDAIVFIVDVADDARFEEVSKAWCTVLELEKRAPILVLMNKIDLMGHTSQSIELDSTLKSEIRSRTGISETGNPGQPIKVEYLSIVREDIYRDRTCLRLGFSWLSDRVNDWVSERDKGRK